MKLCVAMLAAFCLAELVCSAFGEQEVWREDFKPCAAGDSSQLCVNGGIRLDDWSFDIGDGRDNGDALAGWGNQELQCYQTTPEVAKVVANPASTGDGMLAITAVRSARPFSCQNVVATASSLQWASARITTKDKRTFIYSSNGTHYTPVTIEARIKLPSPGGKGLWAAFWLLPQPERQCQFSCSGAYGAWPNSGELDVVEALNDMKEGASTLHYRDLYGNHAFNYGKVELPPSVDGFHVFRMEWSPVGISFWVDSTQMHRVQPWTWNAWYGGGASAAPFDKPFYLILNLAVGGKLPGNPDKNTPASNQMLVDWVRVLGGQSRAMPVAEKAGKGRSVLDPKSRPGVIAGCVIVGAIVLVAALMFVKCGVQRCREKAAEKASGSEDGDESLSTPLGRDTDAAVVVGTGAGRAQAYGAVSGRRADAAASADREPATETVMTAADKQTMLFHY